MTYKEFFNKYNGKYVDTDNYPKEWKYQCFDLAQLYITEVLGLPRTILAGCGVVKNMLVSPKRQVLDNYFDEVPTTQMEQGDLCIWDFGDAGHIAIFDHWDGKNCWYFSQNPNPSQVMVINRDGLHAFRVKSNKPPKIKYRSHIQKIGWQEWKKDGETSGTTGEQKRLEAIQIDFSKDVYAKAHIQKDGWVDYGKITKDTIIGTIEQSKRLECLCLKGDFKYRVHIQGTGWTCWTEADGVCTLGSVGQKLRIEAIEIIAN